MNELLDNLKYNNGNFYWIEIKGSHGKKIAGRINNNGYRDISIKSKRYLAHRLVWLMFTGRFPIGDIDHINGIRTDNRIENLREVTRRENLNNMVCHRNGKLPGCSYFKDRNKWRARTHQNGKTIYFGTFNTELEAHEAYLKGLT